MSVSNISDKIKQSIQKLDGASKDPFLGFFNEFEMVQISQEQSCHPAATSNLENDFSGGKFLSEGRLSNISVKMLEALMFIREFPIEKIKALIKIILEAERYAKDQKRLAKLRNRKRKLRAEEAKELEELGNRQKKRKTD